ncbi:hypothetical protein KIH74_22750 [Kineosporia sp. J2-2]|uniref:Homeodomain-like domain-containing protein n=1 Tax=Kineosporia corallincola TaxID=2835133 RepID=A0ABS5TNZ1_9ACTN|nr:hypothetical protein [Kineosporia corallincola]MBT0771778.1 hypothetical protein [Kineosporia corallincola]
MTKWLTRLSLTAVFVLGIHGEIVVGVFVGLALFAYALPLAIDTYVVAAFRAGRDIAWALSLLAVTIGGGHYLIGATGGDPKRAVKALGEHGSVPQGAMGAAVGVVIVLVLWRVHVLSKAIKADEAAAAQAVLNAERAARDAEIAEQERLAALEHERVEHAARLRAEEADRARAERREREQADRDREEAKARQARENREHAARLAAEEAERRRRAEQDRAAADLARREADARAEEARARVLAEQAAADRAAADRAQAEAAAARAAKAKPPAAAKPEPAGLHAVPSPTASREELIEKVRAGQLSHREAADQLGVSTKTIQRAVNG